MKILDLSQLFVANALKKKIKISFTTLQRTFVFGFLASKIAHAFEG